ICLLPIWKSDAGIPPKKAITRSGNRMKLAPIPHNEIERQSAITRMRIATFDAEPELDRISALARRVFDVKSATITVLDHDRQIFKSRANFNITESRRVISFCGHAITQTEPFVINDARNDDR